MADLVREHMRAVVEPEIRSLRMSMGLRDVRIAELEAVLSAAKAKLELYRAQHSGEYVGGVEFTELMARIDAALSK